MNLPCYLFTVSAFVYFESAITVYRVHPRARLNRLVALLLGSMSLFTAIAALSIGTRSAATALVLTRVLVVMGCFYGPLTLHVALLFGRTERSAKRRGLVLLIYAVPLGLAAAAVAHPLAIATVAETRWGWDATPPIAPSLLDFAYYAVALSYCLAAIVTSVVRALRINDPIVRRQILILLAFTASGLVSAALPSMVNLQGAAYDPDFDALIGNCALVIFLTVFLTGLRFVMWKYRFLVITGESRSAELFLSMCAPLMLVGPDNRVAFANPEAVRLWGGSARAPKDFVGTPLVDLFQGDKRFEEDLCKLARGGARDRIVRLLVPRRAVIAAPSDDPADDSAPALASSDDAAPAADATRNADVVEVTIHPIFSEQGRYRGAIVTASRAARIAPMLDDSGLTDRELEVALLVAEGLSTNEVAEKLYISQLTAKTHIHRVYDKLGVNNRVELLRIVSG